MLWYLQVIQPINGDPFIGMLEVDTLWLIKSVYSDGEPLSLCPAVPFCLRKTCSS